MGACRICGNKEKNKIYVAKEMMYGLRDEFEYLQCSLCKCLQIKEIPKDLGKYYPSQYYSFSKFNENKYEGLNGIIKKLKFRCVVNQSTWWQKLFKKLFYNSHFLNEVHFTPDSRILDVGSGNGSKFLYPLASIGFKNLLGCDPFIQQSIVYKNGLEIRKVDIFKIEGSWDLIAFNHSFEHVPNPLEILQRVYELLSPKGICMIRIPTVSSFAWHHYRTNWFQLDAPRHLFLHSRKSMETIAEQAQLEVYTVVYDSTYKQFEESEKYIQNVSLRAPRPKGFAKFFKRKLRKIKYKNQARKLNQKQLGDQAAFFLRKKQQL